MTDTSIMPFGKHKGKKLIDVPPDYLLFLYDNQMCSGELKDYIEDNMDVLKEELRKNKMI